MCGPSAGADANPARRMTRRRHDDAERVTAHPRPQHRRGRILRASLHESRPPSPDCEIPMRFAFAFFLLIHGIAHLPGFVVPWRLATLTEMPYKTTLFNGAVNAGPVGARVIGLLWLLAGLGCVA